MSINRTAMAAALILPSAPALGSEEQDARANEPRPIAAIPFGKREVELLAVTQRARADTPLSKDYLDQCKAMAKVFPGYPQPALVSVDFRVKF